MYGALSIPVSCAFLAVSSIVVRKQVAPYIETTCCQQVCVTTGDRADVVGACEHERKRSSLTHCLRRGILNLIEVIQRTLDSLALQTVRERLIVVIGWESRTPERETKERELRERYEHLFDTLLFTVHPFGVPGEIAGKCSNTNYTLRQAVLHMFEVRGATDPAQFTCTTCDADTYFHEKYFEALTADVEQMKASGNKQLSQCIWQGPLFYNWMLDQSYFFTRVTGLMRCVFMMGFLIPYNINSMSAFSFSLELAVRGLFFHPQYHMDDIAYLINCMIGTQGRVKIRVLEVPVLSGPTSGVSFLNELYEWYIQNRRWGIGTSDIWHYHLLYVF